VPMRKYGSLQRGEAIFRQSNRQSTIPAQLTCQQRRILLSTRVARVVHLGREENRICRPALSMSIVPTAKDIRGPSPLIAIENEAPAKLIVDPPLPEPLAQGRVFIQYRTENLRVVPVFGQGALEVSPRLGHIHITVDDARWHFVDSSGETIILVGLEPGPHKVLIELADPTHKIITSETVKFSVPDLKTSKSDHHHAPDA
jgi:hypothetical protein